MQSYGIRYIEKEFKKNNIKAMKCLGWSNDQILPRVKSLILRGFFEENNKTI